MIPTAILLLIIVGKLCGIEYGSLKHVVRSLGAVLILLIGIYWMAAVIAPWWVSFFVIPSIASIVTFVLFMNFFDLDAEEARTTSG